VAAETIALIREMAAANRLWGAERIRGELLKLGLRVAKTTVRRHMRDARPPRRGSQTWATFLRNHGADTWACDFLPVTDLLFRPLYAFFIVALESRRVVHVGVTRRPTDAWVAQQARQLAWTLQEAGQPVRYLLHDRDAKFPPTFDTVFAAQGVEVIRTPYRAPNANAHAERWIRSAREECLDHMLVASEAHLRRVYGLPSSWLSGVFGDLG
jgi:transposase InsO family protein